jgi:hypothetical protein
MPTLQTVVNRPAGVIACQAKGSSGQRAFEWYLRRLKTCSKMFAYLTIGYC